MWEQVLNPRYARFGKYFESRIAPRFYRQTPIVTCSPSSREEVIRWLRMPADNVTVASPGIDAHYTPGTGRAPHPLVLAVGRLMPPKGFDHLIRVVDEVRRDVPDLELVIVGDGFELHNLKQLVADLGATDWVRFAGYVSEEEKLTLYQQAWVAMSCSTAEGWGMTMTEAAACGTPAVATDIAGHRDSVADGRSGLLGATTPQLVGHLRAVLTDPELRLRLSEGALKHAADFTWETCAVNTFVPLVQDALRQPNAGATTAP
jgi:glycosyltransferase involved in cell wall biosynthesis